MIAPVRMQILLKSVVVWSAILVVAIANGALRDAVLNDVLGPVPARFLSGVILCALILGAAALSAPWFGSLARGTRWRIGGTWLVLTLGFELAVGFAQHQSWQRLLDAYTFQGGNLWPLVLVTTFIAPWAAARMRGIEQ